MSNAAEAIKKLVDEEFRPVPLSPTERVDLGSITKHPGMAVLFGKIAKAHCDQQQMQVMNVPPTDPNHTSKLAAIGTVTYAMRLFLSVLEKEVNHNWAILEQAEINRKREAENESGNADH